MKNKEHVISLDDIGEAVHTAFRKASSHKLSQEIHTAIDNLPASVWREIVLFIQEGLEKIIDEQLAKREK